MAERLCQLDGSGALKEIALWGKQPSEEGQDQDHPPFCTQDPVTPWSSTISSCSRNVNNLEFCYYCPFSHKQSKMICSDRSVLSMTNPPLNGDISKPRTKRNFMDDGTRRGNVVSAKGEAGPLVGERLLIIMIFPFFFLFVFLLFLFWGQNRCNPGTTCRHGGSPRRQQPHFVPSQPAIGLIECIYPRGISLLPASAAFTS